MQILIDIEDAAMTALAPLKAVGVRTVELYTGQLTEGALSEAVHRFPCVYVIADKVTYEDNNRVRTGRTGVTAIVGDRNVRRGEYVKRGDGESPGVYDVMERVAEALDGLRPRDNCTPFRLSETGVLAYAPDMGLCVYEMKFELMFAENKGR